MIVHLPHTTWEVDTEANRIRFVSQDHPFDAATRGRFGSVFDEKSGLPNALSCVMRNADADGWASFVKTTPLVAGGPFVVRWPNGTQMILPKIVSVEE